MKKVFLVLILLSFFNGVLIAQSYPSLHKVVQNSKVLHGRIDNKHDITIFLKKYKTCPESRAVYTVKGWYYYDKYKKKIPLVGGYDGSLHLYVVSDKKEEQYILDFKSESGAYWERIEYYRNAKNYDEKLLIDGQGKSSWQTKDKTLGLTVYEKDLDVNPQDYFLFFDKENAFNLKNVGLWYGDVQLEHMHGNRFLLSYEQYSNARPNGMCGAGTEAGYLLIVFDDNKNLVSYHDITTESCYQSIYSETKKRDNVLIISTTNDTKESKQKTTKINLKYLRLITE